jgi:hypothetical protein
MIKTGKTSRFTQVFSNKPRTSGERVALEGLPNVVRLVSDSHHVDLQEETWPWFTSTETSGEE